MGVDEETGNQIEIEDVEDAYIVSCDKCGNHLIAKMERELSPPPS